MQRVKAYDLRQKDEKALVEELTKFRVSRNPFERRTISYPLIFPFSIERTRSVESQQGLRCPSGQARSY